MRIDYYAYHSGMRNWNAAFKAVLAVVTLCLVISFNNIFVSMFVVGTMGALTLIAGRIPCRVYVHYLLVPVVFMVFGCLVIAISFAGAPVGEWNLSFHFFYLCLDRESLFTAVKVFFKAMAGVSALYMMSFSTPVNELIFVLQKLHLPGLFLELMHLIYRYVFILFDVAHQMQTAAKARLGYRNLMQSYKSFAAIGGNLFVIALKKANAYYDALLARGYQGRLAFLAEDKPVQGWQIICGILYFAAIILLAVWSGSL